MPANPKGLVIQKINFESCQADFPEQNTKKSFALSHLCPLQEVLNGIWNPLISGQIVN